MQLAELEQRVLATLDEAGAENAVSLLNTIVSTEGDAGEVEFVGRLFALDASAYGVMRLVQAALLHAEVVQGCKTAEVADRQGEQAAHPGQGDDQQQASAGRADHA